MYRWWVVCVIDDMCMGRMRCCSWLLSLGSVSRSINNIKEIEVRRHPLPSGPLVFPSIPPSISNIIIHIQVYDHQPVPYIQVYVHQPSTTLPRFLSPSIVWYIGRGLNCPDEEVYYYEGYSYHLDVYRLLISIYHLHQIATLLILATAEGRRSQWLTYLMSFSNLLQKFYEVVLTPLSKTAPANCNTRMSNPIISILYTLTLFSPLLHPLLLSNL
jgi:hypothetical protein